MTAWYTPPPKESTDYQFFNSVYDGLVADLRTAIKNHDAQKQHLNEMLAKFAQADPDLDDNILHSYCFAAEIIIAQILVVEKASKFVDTRARVLDSCESITQDAGGPSIKVVYGTKR